MTYAETDLVATMEQLAGADLARLTQQQRDWFDQFYAGGPEAVDRYCARAAGAEIRSRLGAITP